MEDKIQCIYELAGYWANTQNYHFYEFTKKMLAKFTLTPTKYDEMMKTITQILGI